VLVTRLFVSVEMKSVGSATGAGRARVTGAAAFPNIFAIGLGIQTLYLKLTGRPFTGFATVILLELIIGSLLMISLGIIGEYLARIYEEVKGRPRYIMTESIEPDSRQRVAPEESLRATLSTSRARAR
jgi:hypothetical protein